MIGVSQIILSSIGGSIFTICINEIIKSKNKRDDLIRQKYILLAFIDEIVLKYLNVNLDQYKELLSDINDNYKLFDSRKFTVSPMLNKNIFDFFERKDLIKIFSYCKGNLIVDFYHNFYEIDFLQNKSAVILLSDFRKITEEDYNVNKLNGESFEEYLLESVNYKNDKKHMHDIMEIYIDQIESLMGKFIKIKEQLINIEELSLTD